MKLKYNNTRDLSDARFAAASMAEWIGFAVDTEHSLTAAQIQEIVQWCAGPKLILELSEKSTPDTVLSIIHVLPVDGLELTLEQWNGLQNMPEIQGFELIFTDTLPSNPTPNMYSHNTQLLDVPNHIIRLNELSTFKEIKDFTPAAISLNCIDSDTPALKNYDAWIDFLESIEML